MTEVTAPIDVFSKPRENGTKLFNAVTVAETLQPVATESGLRMLSDYTLLIARNLPSGCAERL